MLVCITPFFQNNHLVFSIFPGANQEPSYISKQNCYVSTHQWFISPGYVLLLSCNEKAPNIDSMGATSPVFSGRCTFAAGGYYK